MDTPTAPLVDVAGIRGASFSITARMHEGYTWPALAKLFCEQALRQGWAQGTWRLGVEGYHWPMFITITRS